MTKSYSKTVKKILTAVSVVAVPVILYNLCIYFFAFIPTFGRSNKTFSAESEIKHFAGKENWELHKKDAEYIESLNLPRLEMEVSGGLILKAVLWEADSSCRGTVLLMHGYHSLPLREFAETALTLHQAHYNVVLPFQRGHGESGGKYTSFALQERFDVRDWVLKINRLYGEDLPLFLYGISMGSTTVTMASALELPSNVRGIIADCGFTEPCEIIRWTLRHKYHLWSGVADCVLASLNFYCVHSGGFNLKDYSTYDALNKTYLPFLFISGTEDKTVPVEMTMANFLHYKQIYPDLADLLLIEGAGHAVSYMTDKEKYNSKILAFLNRYSGK